MEKGRKKGGEKGKLIHKHSTLAIFVVAIDIVAVYVACQVPTK